jgi:hypothetical protein
MSDTMISPQDLLNVINPLLEKEKQQIIDAYNRGICDNEVLDGQDHYNQTYNQN